MQAFLAIRLSYPFHEDNIGASLPYHTLAGFATCPNTIYTHSLASEQPYIGRHFCI